MKEQLLKLAAIRYGTVTIEGTEVRVREATADEFSRYAALSNDEKDDKDVVTRKGNKNAANATLIAGCIVDEAGASVYNEAEAAVLAASARVSMPVINKIMELSGFKGDAEKHSDAG